MSSVLQDLRLAFRMLGKSPGVTAAAVLTLALGIGVNLALFALLNDQLLRPRDVHRPDELWAILPSDTSGEPRWFNLSRPYYEAVRKSGSAFNRVICYGNLGPKLRTQDGWEEVRATLVSGDYFTFLGVQPILGRGFLPEEDDKPGAARVAVISYRFWQRQFQGNPAVLGKTVTLDDQTVEVVGVAPAGFQGISLYQRDLWLPVSMEKLFGGYGVYNLVGRLKEGVSPAQAAATLAPVVQDVTKTLLVGNDEIYANNISHFTRVALLREGYGSLPAEWAWSGRKQMFKGASLVGVATFLVLLIAVTNLSNLLLARGLRRRKEIATRLAMGATRWRLIRQLLLEGVLLAGLGALTAMLILGWVGNFVTGMMSAAVYAHADIHLRPDIRVVGFALVSALLVGAGFSILPALQASRFDLFVALKDPEGGAGLRERRWSLRKLLMVAQVAASLALLSGTALCLRAISQQLRIDVGFPTESIAVAAVNLEKVGFNVETAQPAVEELRRRFSLMPGVEAVGFMDMLPLMGERGHLVTDRLEGYVVPEGGSIEFGYAAVSPDCFRALGIPLVEGREITESDLSSRRPVALVNESFARKFWPNQTVLGKRLERLHKSYEIVGIVRDARLNTLVQMPEPTIFFVTGADEAQNPNFILRTRGDPKSLLKPIIAELARVHPRLRESHVTSLRQFMRERLSSQREAMTLLGRLAVLALALTVLGVYGMMSFVVAQRTREIGIRIAVGAGRADVARLILLSGFGVVLAGVGIGLSLTLGGASLLRHVVYGVNAFDLPAFGAAAVLVLFAILLACWLPARRASNVDPVVALRHE